MRHDRALLLLAALATACSNMTQEQQAKIRQVLTVACDTASHFFAAATVTAGPANDSPQLRPVMAQDSAWLFVGQALKTLPVALLVAISAARSAAARD